MDDILRQTKASLKTSQEAECATREIEAQLRREHEQDFRRQCEAADTLDGRLQQEVCVDFTSTAVVMNISSARLLTRSFA